MLRPTRALFSLLARRRGLRLLREFDHACRDVARTQRQVLAEILGSLADSEMGRARGFDRCTDPEMFRRTVPITDYEDMRGWIDKMRRTGDPRVMFAPGAQLIMFTLDGVTMKSS